MAYNEIQVGFHAKQFLEENIFDPKKIEQIKKWCDTAEIPSLSTEQIILFLMSCDQNVEYTQKTIKMYYKIKNGSPQLFTNRKIDDPDIQSALKACEICTWRDPRNNLVFIYYKFKNVGWQWNLHTTTKLLFMVIECAIYDHPPNGLISIFNSGEAGLGILTKLFHPKLLHTAFTYVQQAVPIKLKEVHVLNTVPFVDKALKIISPFMDKKLLEQFIFHPCGLNLDEFHKKYIPTRSLPKDLGGELETVEVLQQRMLKKIQEMQPYYDKEEMWCGVSKLC